MPTRDEDESKRRNGKPDRQCRELFQQAPFPYQSLDEEGNIIRVNEAWLGELGYDKEEVRGKWFGNFLTEDDRQKFRNIFPKFKQQGEVNDVKYALKRKDGTKLIVTYGGKVIYDEGGKFRVP